MILNVDVVNKIATFQKRGGCIVCGNSDYQIRFTFDSEWSEFPTKTARFITNGQFTDVDFTGDYCTVPILYDTTEVEIGVYAGELKTTTSAFIGCYRSILCEIAKPSEENDRNYVNEAKVEADRAEAAAEEATQRVEEAVRFSTEKVETATKEAAERAESAAARAEAALKKVDITVDPTLEISGMAADAKVAGDRLKILEEWMANETYVNMKVTLAINKPSIEYGDTVNGVVLNWTVDQEVSSITLTLPGGSIVDVTNKSSYEDPTTYDNVTTSKTWKITATRKDGKQEEVEAKVTMSCAAYVAIKFNSFTMTPSTTRYEYGASIPSIKFKWTLNKPAKEIKVDETTLADASATEYTVTGPFTSNTSWSVTATEKIGKNGTATATKAIEFYYFVYYGVGTLDKGFDGNFVQSLSSGPKETTTQTIGFDLTPNSEYIYYAIPVDLANNPTFIIDKGFAGGFEYFEEVSVTKTILGQDVSIPYYIYRSDQLLSGSTRVDVS